MVEARISTVSVVHGLLCGSDSQVSLFRLLSFPSSFKKFYIAIKRSTDGERGGRGGGGGKISTSSASGLSFEVLLRVTDVI